MGDKVIMEFENVGITYEQGFLGKSKVNIISDVSFVLKNGEILAVVGESGCGKTTIGKVAAGLLQPTSGQVLFRNRNIWKLDKREYKEYRPKIQMVMQDSYASLNPVKNVYKALAIIFQYYGVKRSDIKGKVIESLTAVGINPPEYFMNKFPYHLSGGQRQRLCLAKAIIPNPEIIVADEPVSMVDMSLRLVVLDMMIKFYEEKKISFIFITHDLSVVKYLGNRGKIMVMYLGKVVEYCNIEEAFQNPIHPYLRALIMSAPIPDPRIAKKMPPPNIKSTEIPSMNKKPNGCYFHPRCVFAEEICSKQEPILREISNNHQVACHFADKMPEWKIL